jgi:ribosomal protein S18 acetylase RimI-like enzyme
MSPPFIRPARADDAPLIVDFNCRLAEESEAKVLDRGRVDPGVRAVLADPRKGRYFVAEVDGRVVGQVMHTSEWSDWRNGEIWWIQSVYVVPEVRRSGVFRALYDHLASTAAADPKVVALRLYVEEHNQGARSTYGRLGMEASGYLVLERRLRTDY